MVRYFLLIMSIVAVCVQAQNLEFSLPVKLNTHVNSDCEEILPLLTAGGTSLYFVRIACDENTGGEYAGSDVWISNFNPALRQWNRRARATEVFNDKLNNAVVGIGESGVYLLNSTSTNEPGLYYLKQIDNGWSQPEHLSYSFFESRRFLGAYISPDAQVMLLSMSSSEGRGEDLFVSLKNSVGEWITPRSLGPVINTSGFEISPFLSQDKKRLYFSSNGHGGMGDADIFYSDRLDDSWENWSKPVNLKAVNSKRFDAYFSIYDSVAYFSSNRNNKFSDLYVVRVKNDQKEQERIQQILAEAKSMLTDLKDDTADSLSSINPTLLIGFSQNSSQIEGQTLAQLNTVAADIRTKNVNKVKLVGYTSAAELRDDKLCSRRLEAVKTYFEDIPRLNITVVTELKKAQHDRAKAGLVEVRYE